MGQSTWSKGVIFNNFPINKTMQWLPIVDLSGDWTFSDVESETNPNLAGTRIDVKKMLKVANSDPLADGRHGN